MKYRTPVRMRREEKLKPPKKMTPVEAQESFHRDSIAINPGGYGSLISGTDRRKYEDAVIAEAVKFTATRFMGRGRYDTREASSLPEAEVKAKEIANDAGDKDVGRVMIYAINKAGRQVLVMAGGKMVTT